MGTITTAPQRLASGDNVRHKDNFTLKAGERQEICASGPFYEGQRLEVILRTIIPLFNCRTKIDRGDIELNVTVKESGFRTLTAKCY